MVGLIRSDGVVVGVAFCILGGYWAYRTKVLNTYLQISLVCLLLAVFYLFWRYSYFRMLLPLPLYVKMTRGHLEGLKDNIEWLTMAGGPRYALCLLLVFIGSLIPTHGIQVWRMFLSFIPVSFLFFELIFAVQIQNSWWRFQAPVFVVLLFMLFQSAVYLAGAGQKFLTFLLVVAVFVPVFALIALGISWINFSYAPQYQFYLGSFSVKLGQILNKENKMALTEAGALAYWSNASLEDIAGLNNPLTAAAPATVDYLRDTNPEIMMFHHAGTLKSEMLHRFDKKPIQSITSAVLIEAQDRGISEEYENIFQGGLKSYKKTNLKVEQVAAIVMAKYLTLYADNYYLYSVSCGDDYCHIYALRKDFKLKNDILKELRLALQGNYQSYAQAKHFLFT